MRKIFCLTLLLMAACQATPRGLALCNRVPRYQELVLDQLAVHSVCVDATALAGFSGSAQVTQVLTDSGLQVATDATCDWRLVLSVDAPTLSDQAAAVWNAGADSQERFAVLSGRDSGQAISTIHASSDRGAVYGVRAAVASLGTSPDDASLKLFQSGTIVDYPSFALRGVVESIYGKGFSPAERQVTLNLMNCFGQNLYIYGEKDGDLYTHYQWADPYPEIQAGGLRNTAQTARDNLITFVWAVSPGWWGGPAFSVNSICYSCDGDFERLKKKTEAMRSLGITRFALLLDDLTADLAWPADQMKFDSLVQAHVFLINRWDDYLMATGASEHLMVVGYKYTTDSANQLSGQGWQTYNVELAAGIHSGVQLLWTGPKVFSPAISADDLDVIDQVLKQKVIVWDNWPTKVIPLADRSVDLPTAARGLVSCPVINQREAHPVSDFWPVLGSAADYEWRTDTYVPDVSYAHWKNVLPSLIP